MTPKLFLQSGKLMIGEFPEEPFSYCGCEMCERHKQERFDESVESAKASAVEAVNPEAILTWDDREAWFFEHRAMAEDKLYDIPSGWAVEYEDVPLKLYKQKVVEKIARLIPTSENTQGEKPGSGWSKRNLNVQYVGGIVATGIPEPEQPESKESFKKYLESTVEAAPESGETPEKKLTFCDKCGELIVRGTEHECYYVPVPSEKDVERARMILKANGLYLDQIVGKVYLSKLSSRRNAVPPPSQAEINTTAPVESEEELWDEMVGRCMEFTSFNYALAQKLYVITRKTVEP